MTSTKEFIGIDVSKRTLDIHLRPSSQTLQVLNSEAGLVELIEQLPPLDEVERIVIESTGGYERESALTLSHQGYAVCVINARQGRHLHQTP